MNKSIYQQALERAGGLYCELCGSNNMVTLHHILKGSKRKSCERLETIIFLCYSCHLDSKTGVHFNHQLDLKLKLQLQKLYFSQGLDENAVRAKMGNRLYLEEE